MLRSDKTTEEIHARLREYAALTTESVDPAVDLLAVAWLLASGVATLEALKGSEHLDAILEEVRRSHAFYLKHAKDTVAENN